MADQRYQFSIWIENQKFHCQRDRLCKWIWCGWGLVATWGVCSKEPPERVTAQGWVAAPVEFLLCSLGALQLLEGWTVLLSLAGLKCVFLLQCRKAFRNAVCASTYGKGWWHSALLDSVRKSMNSFAASKELFNMIKLCAPFFFKADHRTLISVIWR